MAWKLRALPNIKHLTDELIDAIKEYREDPDFDEIELERALDNLLTKLPRDIVYVEWFDRSDVKNMADGVYDDPVSEDMVDICMHDLDRFNGSIMQNETVEYIVADSVRVHHKEA